MGKKVLLDPAVPLAKDLLPKSTVKATSSVLDRFKRKISGRGVVRAVKEPILIISNEDMDIIKITEWIKKWCDWNSETGKVDFLGALWWHLSGADLELTWGQYTNFGDT